MGKSAFSLSWPTGTSNHYGATMRVKEESSQRPCNPSVAYWYDHSTSVGKNLVKLFWYSEIRVDTALRTFYILFDRKANHTNRKTVHKTLHTHKESEWAPDSPPKQVFVYRLKTQTLCFYFSVFACISKYLESLLSKLLLKYKTLNTIFTM